MGGIAKGLLPRPDGAASVVGHAVELAKAVASEVVLVGAQDAYASLGLETIEDSAPDAGPLGGLVALLERARGGRALALACDMPFLTLPLVRRLSASPAGTAAVAPRSGPLWEPLFACYDAALALPAARRRLARGELSLQPLLDELGATELVLSDAERAALRDWDHPGDLA